MATTYSTKSPTEIDIIAVYKAHRAAMHGQNLGTQSMPLGIGYSCVTQFNFYFSLSDILPFQFSICVGRGYKQKAPTRLSQGFGRGR